jgi:hypothetical protein
MQHYSEKRPPDLACKSFVSIGWLQGMQQNNYSVAFGHSLKINNLRADAGDGAGAADLENPPRGARK